MKQKNFWIVLAALTAAFLLVVYFAGRRNTDTGNPALAEQKITQIQLAGPAADRAAEISGLAWYGDNLILLPQYPNVFDENGDGFLYYLPKDEITAYLDEPAHPALEPHPIQLVAPGLAQQIPAYQGFESIGFSGDQVFMTIESGEGTDMLGHLISGTIAPDLSTLTLDTVHLSEIQPQAESENHADEALLVLKDRVITFYEVNGEKIVAAPVAHVFDHKLNSLGTIPMQNLEYRLTDTALFSGNEFWGINYFFPGDADLLPAVDPIRVKYGIGESQVQFDQVERLVKFIYSESGITLADAPPVPLVLEEDIHNWEGLVIFDQRGFLMATDKFPSTMLGFVPFP